KGGCAMARKILAGVLVMLMSLWPAPAGNVFAQTTRAASGRVGPGSASAAGVTGAAAAPAAAPAGATATTTAAGDDQRSSAPAFKPEQLEQLVAPIALYPDSLIAQILMASTYPLEIVQADRWVKDNAKLKDDPQELNKLPYDPSVKSLLDFPQVLDMMSKK